MKPVEVTSSVYWVGAVDWGVRDFHGYSTPLGSTYNAYLLVDEIVVLFDTVKKGFAADLLARVSEIIDPAKIDYIVVNHVEMDHTGSLPEIIEAAKPEKIICSSQGQKALQAHFPALFGPDCKCCPLEVVANGQEISTGKKTIQFLETRMLHWPDSMFSYLKEDALLISQDGFGQHWATSARFDDEVDQAELMRQSAKYYANILLPYSTLVQRLLAQVAQMGLKIDIIAPDHGLIWRSDPGKIIAAWDRWSRQIAKQKALVVYDTMWRSTEAMARAIARGVADGGVEVKVMDLATCHRSDIITELLDAKAIVLGSATLNNGMLPRMADFLCYMRGLRPIGKIAASFGSYGWGGEAAKLIHSAIEEMKLETAAEPLRVNYVPTAEDLKQCEELGSRIASLVTDSTSL